MENPDTGFNVSVTRGIEIYLGLLKNLCTIISEIVSLGSVCLLLDLDFGLSLGFIVLRSHCYLAALQ